MGLPVDLKVTLRQSVNLSKYCTMQVGGKADYFAEPSNEEELREALDFAKSEKLPYILLGKGSNMLFPDEGYRGMVISMIHFADNDIAIDQEKNLVTASSGVYLYRLALTCRDKGLAGTEFLASIPGTVGGALVMNAGYSRHAGQTNEISDIVHEVTILDDEGNRQVLGKDALQFSYRKSNLKGKIVLAGTFALWSRNSDDIESEIRANFSYRNEKQDLMHPSSGSIFKNPSDKNASAGKLIDTLGLKGLRVGDAMISPKHGNYFINLGHAKTSDVIELIKKVQSKVFDATQISLETEVQIINKS